jgi:nucleobase:cation symporter-1, NCS1 family
MTGGKLVRPMGGGSDRGWVSSSDQLLRRGKRVDGFLFDRKHNPWGGFAAMAIAMAVSIYFFSNQTEYVGLVPKHSPGFGDITFEVGFVLAALLYAVFFRLQGDSSREEALVIPGEQPAAQADNLA